MKSTEKLIKERIKELEEENERLELELFGYRTAILKDDKLLGLQQRINKAIEQINKISEKHLIDLNYELEYLLQILQGEDNGKDN